jgi:predicted  nucleic acid-binding Zn-ribbon protein
VIDNEDPATQLRRLRDCLEQAQKAQKNVEGDVQRFDAQVKELAKFVDEFEKIVAEYRKEQRRLWDDQNGYKDFQDKEVRRLKQELGDQIDRIIKEKVGPVRAEIGDLERIIPETEAQLSALKQSFAQAVKKRDDAKGIFEMWKKPVASIKERHGRLKAFSDEVNEACKAGELAFAYWLLTAPDKFNEKLLAPPDVAPVDELQQRLIDAWNAYARAIKEAQDLDGQVKGTEERLKTMRTRLDEAKKKFDARVRAALSNFKPK